MSVKVGQKIYLKPVGNNARYTNGNIIDNIREVTVGKVGRKYFYLEEFGDKKFEIEEMRDFSNYSASWEVYLDPQDIKDEFEASKLLTNIRMMFEWSSRKKFTLDQLRRIFDITQEKV